MKKVLKSSLSWLLVLIMVAGILPIQPKVEAFNSGNHVIYASDRRDDGQKKFEFILERIKKQNFDSDKQKEKVYNAIKYFMYDAKKYKANTRSWDHPNYYGVKTFTATDGNYSVTSTSCGCYAFANFIMGSCYKNNKTVNGNTFGDVDVKTPKSSSYNGKISLERLKELMLRKAQAGEAIRVGVPGCVHSMVYLCGTSKGMYFMDSGYPANAKVEDIKLKYMTWEKLLSEINNYPSKYFYIENACSAFNNVSRTLTLQYVNTEGDVSTEKTIKCAFSEKMCVRKACYVISTNREDIAKDLTLDENIAPINKTGNHDNKIGKDGKEYTLYEDNNSTQKPPVKSDTSYTIKNLKPGTIYYYKFRVKSYAGWFQSDLGSFITPFPSTGITIVDNAAQVLAQGINLILNNSTPSSNPGDTIAVSVTRENGGTSGRTAPKDGTVVYTDTLSAANSNIGIDGSAFEEPGEYKVELKLTDSDSNVIDTETVDVTVMEDVTVKFVDTVTDEEIQSFTVPYGGDSPVPAEPEQDGYIFKGWDGDYTGVTEDTTVYTKNAKAVYTVKFVDSLTGEILKSEKVEYGLGATAPQVASTPEFEFSCWDADFTNVTDNITVRTVYKVSDSAYPLTTVVNSFARSSTKDGYNYSFNVTNRSDSTEQGRLVIALMTNAGYIYKTVDSRAFSVSGNDVVTVNGYVASSEFADRVEVFTINNWEDAGPLAAPVAHTVSNSDCWSPWTEYDGVNLPVSEGVNGVTAVDTKTESAPPTTLYRYRTVETVDSYEPNLEGYTNTGYELVDASTKTLKYVKSWPSGFYKKNSLYTKYNVSPVKASETDSTKTVVNKTEVVSYIYWHWCRGTYTDGPINRAISTVKTSEFSKFHAFESTTKKDYDTAARAAKYSKASACTDSYWWDPDNKNPISVYKETYTTYKKLYHYERVTEYGAWTAVTPEAAGVTEAALYESTVIPGETLHYYRYLSNNAYNSTVTVPENHTIGSLSGYVNAEFAGREATVFIYKYTQPENYTTEYVTTVEAGVNGEIYLDDVILRELPSNDISNPTGDFSISASIKGCTGSVAVLLDEESAEKLKAPKNIYTVTFLDFDNSVIDTVEVEEGGTVTAPTAESVHVDEGCYFTGWNLSTVNVRADLTVKPIQEKKDCVVTIIDWNSQTYEMQELKYGDEIVLPGLNKEKYRDSFWVLDNVATKEITEEVTEVNENGETVTRPQTRTIYVATGNMVITSNFREEEIRTVYIDPEFATVLKERHPEITVDEIGGNLVTFFEDHNVEDLVKALDGYGENTDYYNLSDEEKLDVLSQIIDEEFAEYITGIVAEEYNQLSAQERAEIVDELNEIFSETGYQIVKKNGEGAIDVPEIDDEIENGDDEEAPAYIFYGWKNAKTGELLDDLEREDDEVYLPVYDFAKTCETPVASVVTGEYLDDSISIELSCEDENAVIWYTLSYDMNSLNNPMDENQGIEYTGTPIVITRSCVLMFYATSLGCKDSGIVTEVYAMNGPGKGTKYNIVNVNNNLKSTGSDGSDETVYQCLVKEGQLLYAEPLLNIEGNTFDGLYYDSEFEDSFDYTSETIESDVLEQDENGICQLYAKYTPLTFTATFYDYDGRLLGTRTVEYGEAADAPVPTRNGYVFIGWDSDDYLCVTQDGEFTARYESQEQHATVTISKMAKNYKKGSQFFLGGKVKITYNNETLSFNNFIKKYADFGISFTTDDPDIATVDHLGYITFHKVGKVSVSVTIDSNGETEEKDLEVTPNDADSVTLSANSSLRLDSQGYVREIKAGTAVEDVRHEFLTEDLVFTGINGEVLGESDVLGTGTTVSVYDEDGTLLDSKIIIVTGDFDGDGAVTVRDASHVHNYVLEKEEASLYQQMAIDCNGDGRINTRDASMILRYCVGKETF